MVMKATVADIEEIDEALRSEYKQVEVVDPVTKVKTPLYVLDIEGHDAHPGMKKVKSEAAANRIKANDLQKLVGKFEKFKDLDPDDVLAKLDRYPELELLAEGKVDDKKIEELVDTRVKAKLTPLERELNTTKTKFTELEKENGVLKGEKTQRKIADTIRTAATKLKVRPQAFEDAEMYAMRDFEVSEDGSVATKSGLDVESWMTEMIEKRPYWLLESEGSGSRGGGKGDAGNMRDNPWSAEHWDMSRQNKIYKENKEKADKMAKAAGTTLGGLKPAAKK